MQSSSSLSSFPPSAPSLPAEEVQVATFDHPSREYSLQDIPRPNLTMKRGRDELMMEALIAGSANLEVTIDRDPSWQIA